MDYYKGKGAPCRQKFAISGKLAGRLGLNPPTEPLASGCLGSRASGVGEFGAACERARIRSRLELGQRTGRWIGPSSGRARKKARRAA